MVRTFPLFAMTHALACGSNPVAEMMMNEHPIPLLILYMAAFVMGVCSYMRRVSTKLLTFHYIPILNNSTTTPVVEHTIINEENPNPQHQRIR